MKYLKLIALLIPVVMISCSKDDDDNNNGGTTPQTNTEKLCGKNWKYSKIESDTNNDGVADVDITSQFDACELDDFNTFNTNSTGTYNNGPTKCVSSDPQTSAFTWTWLANETQLKWDAISYNVIINDGNTLKLRYNTLIVTFVK